MEHTAKHLELIQNVISRLAHQSFALKSIAVTLVLAAFAFVGNDGEAANLWIALLPVVTFWGLDAYYLQQERMFRCLYRAAAKSESQIEAFSLNVDPFKKETSSWFATIWSKTLLWFYGPIIGVVAIYIALKV